MTARARLTPQGGAENLGEIEGPKLTAPQLDALEQVLAIAPADLQPDDLAARAGLTRREAISVMVALSADAAAELWMVTFHSCGDDPIGRRRFHDPLPRGACPRCASAIDADALTYELELHLTEPVAMVRDEASS